MSPAQNQSGRPPSSLLGSQFASSNSTANRFLGSTQRPWMTHNSTSSLLSGRSYPKHPVAGNTQAKHSTASSGQQRQSTTKSPAHIETSDHRSTATYSSNPTTTRSMQNAPVSPVTPGYSENDIQPPSAKVARPDYTVSTASFPTPEPSNASLASPVVAVTEVADSSGRDVPQTAGASVSPPRPVKWEGATPTLPAATYHPNPAQQQQALRRSTNQNSSRHSQPPSQPQHQLLPPSQSQSSHHHQQQHQHLSPSPRGQIWQHARGKLKSYLEQSTRTNHLSETVELPRVRILQDACSAEDMFYLALHQTFCLNSADPSQLSQVADQGILPGLGFDVIAQLLVDNKRLSSEFLRWSIEYPFPLHVLLQFEEYKSALKQVSHCLATISHNWPRFEREIRSRGHPPQVDELVNSLGVESPVFQTIIFTAISRRLFGAREELFKACTSLFDEDQRTYKHRSTLPADARRKAIFDYFERYRQICASHGLLVASGASGDQRAFASPRPTPSSIQPPTSMTMTSPNTSLQRNSIQNHVSMSIPHRPSSNPHPDTSYGRPHPLPVSPISHHHVSPAGQQRQQERVSRQNNAPNAGTLRLAQEPQPPLLTSQGPGFFPPPQYTVVSQSHIPVSTAAPNQMPPPGLQIQPSFPHSRQNSSGYRSSTALYPPQYFSPLINPNMSPSLSPPTQQMFSPTHPPPNATRQNQRPQHSQRGSQPVPGASSPLLMQPSGTPFTIYPQTPNRPMPPFLATQQPAQHNPNPKTLPDVIQYFSGFSVPPQRLPPNRSSFSWNFTVPREALRLRPNLIKRPNGTGFVPVLSDGNISYRLRCIKYQGRLDVESVAAWSRAESNWPDVVYIHVNNKEVHRSLNTKGSPISINSFLVDGTNEIRVNVLHSKEQRTADIWYAVAVEVLLVKSPDNFRKLVKRLPAQETREQIQARLSSSNTNDDELMIMDDFISIDLRDPFTTRIFEIPVRSSLCTHRECFDLSTFLQTLAAKAMGEKHTIYVRCPICRKDARPDLLVIDEFLDEVRATLSKGDKLQTAKAIHVKSDGSWLAVLEVESDNRTATSRKRDRSSFEADLVKDESRPASTPRATTEPEVIELD
uniref:Zinc finger MIZ domain-containing protein 1 n=1 Tax=Talaromyces marneffei PM1 TaxID=1077442 RepID=A0A093VZM8_TALMA